MSIFQLIRLYLSEIQVIHGMDILSVFMYHTYYWLCYRFLQITWGQKTAASVSEITLNYREFQFVFCSI